MKELSQEEYQNQFRDQKRERALERAWKNRDFEIELYWKRATYFWAFTAATFTAYFVVISQDTGSVLAKKEYLELVVAIMGFIFSLAWLQVNRGSKKWQENWEKHIDQLEDEITGPIYKTVLIRDRPSVSKTNQKISAFVTAIWVFLIANYFDLPEKIEFNMNPVELIAILIGFYFTLDLLGFRKWIYKKLKPKSGDYQFELRKKNYKHTQTQENGHAATQE
ncbi:hypothetical protein [Roseivirga pacifica]|uniref:RipA family octameric membrane protein n=1 Tax=Roseivirga pacifica TaxID=1267423 RepID=UPI003BAA46F5